MCLTFIVYGSLSSSFALFRRFFAFAVCTVFSSRPFDFGYSVLLVTKVLATVSFVVNTVFPIWLMKNFPVYVPKYLIIFKLNNFLNLIILKNLKVRKVSKTNINQGSFKKKQEKKTLKLTCLLRGLYIFIYCTQVLLNLKLHFYLFIY